jgi:hypothetical protein
MLYPDLCDGESFSVYNRKEIQDLDIPFAIHD